MKRITARLAFGICCCVLPAKAQDVHQVASQALFDEGRRLMAEGHFAEACTKLAESQRVDPAAGTLLNLAVCHENEGRTATAWLEYNEVLTLVANEPSRDRVSLAHKRIAEIEPRLSWLQLRMPAHAPSGLWIELDGVRLNTVVLGTRLPLDPGTHRLRAGAPGKVTASFQVQVEQAGSRMSLELPELAKASRAAPSRPGPARPPGADLRDILMGSSFGLAVGAIGASIYFGVEAGQEWDRRNAHCRGGCDQEAVTAGARAETLARATDVSVGVAAAALAAGTYLLLTRHRAEPSGARIGLAECVGAGQASLCAVGSF